MTETYLTVFNGCDFSGSKYGNQERIEAIVNYTIHGSFKKAAKATGIPASTIRDWAKTEWWLEATALVRSEKEAELYAGFTRIIFIAIEKVEDALKNGEVKLVKTKEGYEERRVSPTAKDAAVIAGIFHDKKRLIENLPTSITQTDSNASIQAKLEQVSRDLRKLEGMDAVLVTDPKKEE